MLTAKIQDKDRSMGMEMGADAYVSKPFNTPQLLELIKETLTKK
jgi:DNA-binding response OmpR family regulator